MGERRKREKEEENPNCKAAVFLESNSKEAYQHITSVAFYSPEMIHKKTAYAQAGEIKFYLLRGKVSKYLWLWL